MTENFRELLSRNTIGFDTLIDQLTSPLAGANDKYPPYNIIRESPTLYKIEVALAGWKPEDIYIFTEPSGYEMLSGPLVAGGNVKRWKTANVWIASRSQSDGEVPLSHAIAYATSVVHRGIAKRDFSLTFFLAEGMKVSSAEFQDGLLHVWIARDMLAKDIKKREIEIKLADCPDCGYAPGERGGLIIPKGQKDICKTIGCSKPRVALSEFCNKCHE